MTLIGFALPDDFGKALVEAGEKLKAEVRLISGFSELNKLDLTSQKAVIGLNIDEADREKIAIKTGSDSVFIWLYASHDKKIPSENSGSDFETGYHHFVEMPHRSLHLFSEYVISLVRNHHRDNHGQMREQLLDRLNLIHSLTRIALSDKDEIGIRGSVMTRLTEYYNANTCSYLEYDDKGELFLQSYISEKGTLKHGMDRKISNKSEYEECVECGDPIINCRPELKDGSRFICAPLNSMGATVGILRLRYHVNIIDITLDRTVLRIAADILATSKLRAVERRKRIESETRSTTILDTAVDAIITIDDRGSIETFNQAAEQLFGFKDSEVVGKNVHVLMPQPYKKEHDGYIRRYKQTGEKQIIGIGREVSGKRKDGSVFPMYLAVSEYHTDGKRKFTGILRDMTEERRLEQEVMRISEHERHRIGQDLHDGLGQMLSGIGMLSRRVAVKLEKQAHELSGDMQEISDLVREADEYSRGLARGLVKIDLDHGGFVAAIENLARQSEKLFRIECSVDSDDEIDIAERNRAENIYRIIQEAINNAVKHGQASKVQVKLRVAKSDLHVLIQDNGTGFPPNWRLNRGLGVRIMEFRSRLIGGHFEQHNHTQGGAIIECILPNP